MRKHFIAALAVLSSLAALFAGLNSASADNTAPVTTISVAPVAKKLPTLPECETEDSDNCTWHARRHGNGKGKSFIAYRGVVFYPAGK